MSQYYIGAKQVQATEAEKDGQPGYRVLYPNGYESWSPKDVFEKAYFWMGVDYSTSPISNNVDKITEEMVRNFIQTVTVNRAGVKTTVVTLTLVNGFEITETASCVEATKYDHALGTKIATQRATDKVWMLLGFLLQCARNGVKPA